MSARLKRSKEARTRGPDNESPLNVRDADTPQVRPKNRYTRADLVGEERQAMLHLAQDCGRAALTEYETAQAFGISLTTLQQWLAWDPGFANVFEVAKDAADERVERALFHRAVGYQYRSEKVVYDREDKVISKEVKMEHVPPDKTAIIFWLKNRKRNVWRDVNQVEHQGEVSIKDKAADPRTLALALLAVLRDINEDEPLMIEHEDEEDV